MSRRRQRARHPGRQSPRVQGQVGGRSRADRVARGRQVRRRGLQDLRRPARRRRVGGERAVEPARPRDPPRRRKWEQHFAKGGRPQDKLTKGEPSKKHGTTITFWPDPTIFEETEFRAQTLLERLREMAFLNKGLEIRFRDERVDPVLAADFRFTGGITDFVKHLNESKEPLFKRVIAYIEDRRGLRGRRRDAVEHRASTRASTRSPTTSPPPRAACTRRASRRPSPTW